MTDDFEDRVSDEELARADLGLVRDGAPGERGDGVKRTIEVASDRELDKRTYLPGVVIEGRCPVCGSPYAWDGSQRYLSFPVPGEPKKITGYCDHEDTLHEGEEDAEWPLATVTVRIVVDVEP